MDRYDAVVVGAGPNGLAAAIVLAAEGLGVLVREAAAVAGGGARSEALTLPGFLHDVCSAVHPLAAASPFFRAHGLERHGLEWIHPPAPLAHPMGGGEAVLLERSPDATAAGLGPDGEAYLRLVTPFLEDWGALVQELLAPLHWPRHPALLARFGMVGLGSVQGLATRTFRGERARALLAGNGAHSVLPLTRPPSAAVGLVLALAGHAAGWPVPRGGAGAVARALVSRLEELGGEVRTDAPVAVLAELPPARVLLLDVAPRQALALAGDRLPRAYRRRLSRFRHGPGAFKLDWALSDPIPWAAPECRRAGTVHLGGSLAEIAEAEAAPWRGRVAERPFVLLAQPSLFDDSRAPPGRHTAWAYCHVPHGWEGDATAAVEAQVERFAPGFRDTILARSALGPPALERRNPNLVGGDVTGGVQDLGQLFHRPAGFLRPYRTPARGVYLCSASTPPGGGVHGMCGYHAARAALSDCFGVAPAEPLD